MYLTRHKDLLGNIDLNTSIVIAGVGSIGSYACLALAKLGFKNIVVIDDGIIEEENIAPQFYRMRDIGKKKVVALKQAILDLTGTEILTVDGLYNPDTYELVETLCGGTPEFLVLAVDSMKARHDICYDSTWKNCIDARMAIEFLAIYSVGTLGMPHYGQTLHSDADSVQEACTNKAISYTSLIAGGLVAKKLVDRLKGEQPQFSVTQYDINAFDMVRM